MAQKTSTKQWADLQDLRSVGLSRDTAKGCPACPRGWLQLCPAVHPPTAQGSLGVCGKQGGVLLPACSHWDHENQGDTWHLSVPLVSTRRGESAAANGQCVTDQGGCQSRLWKSDFLLHFSAGEKVTTSPFRIVSLTLCAGCSDAGRWEGKEPGPQYPLAQNHEEMLNWHLELSVMAGLGARLCFTLCGLPKASFKYLEPSPPKSVQDVLFSARLFFTELFVSIISFYFWNSLH